MRVGGGGMGGFGWEGEKKGSVAFKCLVGAEDALQVVSSGCWLPANNFSASQAIRRLPITCRRAACARQFTRTPLDRAQMLQRPNTVDPFCDSLDSVDLVWLHVHLPVFDIDALPSRKPESVA